MKGVILCGGLGTRLRPATNIYNKHLALVYNQPMVVYPIMTLRDMGCTNITLVSGGGHIGGLADLLGDGHDYDVDITYRIQATAGGIAQALGCVEPINETFPVILGDNYFSTPPPMRIEPTMFYSGVTNPQEYGVYVDGRIVEKPKRPETNRAIVGLYLYDGSVFDKIKQLHPSQRGELEITDINNWYLAQGAYTQHYEGFWGDMGTPGGLLRAANYIQEAHERH